VRHSFVPSVCFVVRSCAPAITLLLIKKETSWKEVNQISPLHACMSFLWWPASPHDDPSKKGNEINRAEIDTIPSAIALPSPSLLSRSRCHLLSTRRRSRREGKGRETAARDTAGEAHRWRQALMEHEHGRDPSVAPGQCCRHLWLVVEQYMNRGLPRPRARLVRLRTHAFVHRSPVLRWMAR
jgi:hypothetical protein